MLPRLTGAPAVSFPRSPAFRHRFDPLNLSSTPELGPLAGSRPSARGRGTSLSVTLRKGLRQRDASSQLAELLGTHRVGERFSAFRSHGR
jgi:hypothetical protein